MQHCTLNHDSWGVYRGFKDYGQNYGLDAQNYGQKPNTMICFFRRLSSPAHTHTPVLDRSSQKFDTRCISILSRGTFLIFRKKQFWLFYIFKRFFGVVMLFFRFGKRIKFLDFYLFIIFSLNSIFKNLQW